jgi:hypothetical protein
MTTKAPSKEPLATPNDAEAAPPAGGASAAPVGDVPADAPLLVMDDEGVADPDTPLVELAAALGVDEKLALGPMALLDTVLTSPETVAKLDCTLATGPLILAAELCPASAELVCEPLGNVTWMRISSHWAPIHSSYRL